MAQEDLETWVSTDSKKIAKVSESFGAKIIDRPSELATDTCQSDDSLVHFATKVDFVRALELLCYLQNCPSYGLESDILLSTGNENGPW